MTPIRILFALLVGLGVPAAYARAQDSAPSRDGRIALELSPAERAMILEEMRLFLDGVQKLTGALGRQDMVAVGEAARGMGKRMAHEVPPALRAKLPAEFRQLGFSVHDEFDQMALDAESLKDVSYSLNQLSATLQKCVACHAAYQIPASAATARQ